MRGCVGICRGCVVTEYARPSRPLKLAPLDTGRTDPSTATASFANISVAPTLTSGPAKSRPALRSPVSPSRPEPALYSPQPTLAARDDAAQPSRRSPASASSTSSSPPAHRSCPARPRARTRALTYPARLYPSQTIPRRSQPPSLGASA
eukprot:scaffold46884_cov63-Phaeocystis_antarctica.AAC.5